MINRNNICVLILTLNEEIHIERCITSLKDIGATIVVVDSYSKDKTVNIAKSAGAVVYQRNWDNYSNQFNWGLSQINSDIDWVIRLDADEVISHELAVALNTRLATISPGVIGIYCDRFLKFQGDDVKRGGVFPISVMRIFRRAHGRCESRWMDEHIVVEGATTKFPGSIVDDNLKSITWWTEKHNGYASREAIDILNQRYSFLRVDKISSSNPALPDKFKRFLKENIYLQLPFLFRAGLYFIYRYIIRLGFLDTHGGRNFHILQGLWYRYLVDMKVIEITQYMQSQDVECVDAIKAVLGIDPTLLSNSYIDNRSNNF